MSTPLLSILTPTIPARLDPLRILCQQITPQLAGHPVEHLYIGDHCGMSIGEKRQRLVDMARGDYIAFVDDDDSVSDDYVEHILKAIQAHGADVITFRQEAWYCGEKAVVYFHSQHIHDEPFRPGAVIRRGPWHVCAWRKAVIADCQFLSCNYGEDFAWVQQARQRIRRASHIDRILHTYRHDPETTAAPER